MHNDAPLTNIVFSQVQSVSRELEPIGEDEKNEERLGTDRMMEEKDSRAPKGSARVSGSGKKKLNEKVKKLSSKFKRLQKN